MSNLMPSSTTHGFFQSLPVIPPQYSGSTSVPSDDPLITSILSLYLPTPLPTSVDQSIGSFARKVVHSSTLEHVVEAETHLPSVHKFTTFGEETRTGSLRTSAGWKVLKDVGTENGVVAHGYSRNPIGIKDDAAWNRRIHQFMMMHLWSSSSALTTCPMAMTDGAAVLIARQLSARKSVRGEMVTDDAKNLELILNDAYRRLISFDPKDAWTSGQWMTERSGGSDVSGTETVARRMTAAELAEDQKAGRNNDSNGLPLGSWRIDGFKWFSSATDADMVVLLAKTEKGISTFFAPMRRRVIYAGQGFQPDDLNTKPPAEMNGVYIQRLKSKLGTKALPTAELLIRGMRGYLIGKEGEGIREISSILNITRLHTAVGNVGYLGRGLAVARAYTRVRGMRSGPLADNPQHLKWMADETIKYLAAGHLGFFGVALLGCQETVGHNNLSNTLAAQILPHSSNPMSQEYQTIVNNLLRLLTPVMKAQCSHASITGLRACMESLGGVGYCENNEPDNLSSSSSPPGILNVARIFRDSIVGVIWEGTTSVLGDDVVRVLKNPHSGKAVLQTYVRWVDHILEVSSRTNLTAEFQAIRSRLEHFAARINSQSTNILKRSARELLSDIEEITCSCLLIYDASITKEASHAAPIRHAIAKRYINSRFQLYFPRNTYSIAQKSETQEEMEKDIWIDKFIFLGESDTGRTFNQRNGSSVIMSSMSLLPSTIKSTRDTQQIMATQREARL